MPSILRAKCIVVGDTCVGKSAISQVFHSDGSHFPKNYSMTTGIELCVKTVNIPDTQDMVEIYVVDSAGKEVFFGDVQKQWSQPGMLVLVYDVTNEQSFNSASKWLQRVRSQKPEVSYPGVLLANKIDLDERRLISPKEGKDFAESNGLEYFECSAKEMQNVEQPFHYLACSFYKMFQERMEIMKAN